LFKRTFTVETRMKVLFGWWRNIICLSSWVQG